MAEGWTTTSTTKPSKPPRSLRSRCWRPIQLNNQAWTGTDTGDVPGPRSGAASVVVGSKMYMFGGYGGSGRLDDFFEFDFDTRVWRRVEYSGPGPGVRENNGVVEYGGKLYLFGGYNGSCWLNDFHEFDLEKRTWRLVIPETPLIPAARFGYVSAVHRHYFVLFGGYDGSTWLNDMHRFDFTRGRWEQMPTTGAIPSIRSCPSWCKEGSKVYVFGGYDGVQRMNDFYACDLNTYTWSLIPALGEVPSPRYFHSCAVHGGCMYVFGGYDGTQRLNDMYEHDFETGWWRRIEGQGEVPIGRSSLVAQVYGSSLYVFGGYNGQVVLNDFHEYRFEPLLVPPSTLAADLRGMVNCRELSDVTFLVDGFPVFASRAHLAARSEHFRAMLYGGLRESQAGCEIEVKDVSHAVFIKMLEYLYTDTVGDLAPDLAVQLLMASERYLLDRLKALCEESIRKGVTVENVVGVFLTAHKHNAEGLKEICLDYILDNLEAVKGTQSFNELKSEPDLLFEIIMAQR
eukprot:TRINITY_DN16471_c0_g1_i1.p1 TRINITY_DN16471_c0_g1~~TRINITY_DN16471_c0_g1_i1.p1  ORF type:complete len:513 (-),score=180.22 TRINITY_DN16471_c0_g1_i1:25-1563(-)